MTAKDANPSGPSSEVTAAAAGGCGFGEEQEALVLNAWNAMKGESASSALKFFLRYCCCSGSRLCRYYAVEHLSGRCCCRDIMPASLSLELRNISLLISFLEKYSKEYISMFQLSWCFSWRILTSSPCP